MEGHEFEIILMRPDAEMCDAGERLVGRLPVRDEEVGGEIVEVHSGLGSANVQPMSTLAKIEAAAKALPPNEREELAMKLIANLPNGGPFMPEPRDYSKEVMREWLDDDERQSREIREMPRLKQP